MTSARRSRFDVEMLIGYRHLARTVTSSGWTFSLVAGEARVGSADQAASPTPGYGEAARARHLPLDAAR